MNEGWLEKYYSNISKFASSFQIRIILSHIQQKNEIEEINRGQEAKNIVNISERSAITTLNVFSKMLIADGVLDEIEFKLHEHFSCPNLQTSILNWREESIKIDIITIILIILMSFVLLGLVMLILTVLLKRNNNPYVPFSSILKSFPLCTPPPSPITKNYDIASWLINNKVPESHIF
jgi:hypothetical protein